MKETKDKKELAALIQYIISMVMFGANGVVASFISLDSYEIVFMRTVIGGLVLTGIFFLTGHRLTVFKYKKQSLYLVVSGAAMVASWMFQFEAYEHVGVSVATLLYYSGPVIVMALSPLLFGERLTAPKLMGFAAVVLGVLLVNGRIENADSGFGIFCGLMSAVMYAVMVTFNKQATNVDGLEIAMLQLIIAFVCAGMFVFLKQGLYIDIKKSDIIPILILGVVNTGITCYIYFTTIKSLKVQTVAICSYIDLLASVLFSFAFLGETLGALQIVGAMLILGGAMGREMSRLAQKGSKV